MKKISHIYKMEYYSGFKKLKIMPWDMDEPWEHYAKWNDQVTDRQVLHDSTYLYLK
jgi:hypothetical protein